MLDENRLIYEEVASALLPNWRDMDKNELIRTASNLPNGPNRDSYTAAIMLKYWSKISKFYNKCKLVATQEDVHMWLTMAVIYALDNKPWDNPKSSIYNDKTGPDKVVNRVMECRRITFYQQLNRFNRKINSAVLSLDSLTDEYKDLVLPTTEDSYIVELFDIVTNKFNEGEYLMAFVLDALLCENLQNRKEDHRKFLYHIRNLDDNFCAVFEDRYGVSQDAVKQAVKSVNQLNSTDLKKRIEYNLIRIKELLRE